MATKNLSDPDHLLRHVRAARVERDPDTGAVLGLLPQAFELRPTDGGLSASWLEFFAGSPSAQHAAAMAEFAGVFEVKKNDRFALGRVEEIRAACARFDVQVRVVHDGDGYPSHASVRRLGGAPPELLDLLAGEAWARVVDPSPASLQISKGRAKAR